MIAGGDPLVQRDGEDGTWRNAQLLTRRFEGRRLTLIGVWKAPALAPDGGDYGVEVRPLLLVRVDASRRQRQFKQTLFARADSRAGSEVLEPRGWVGGGGCWRFDALSGGAAQNGMLACSAFVVVDTPPRRLVCCSSHWSSRWRRGWHLLERRRGRHERRVRGSRRRRGSRRCAGGAMLGKQRPSAERRRAWVSPGFARGQRASRCEALADGARRSLTVVGAGRGMLGRARCAPGAVLVDLALVADRGIVGGGGAVTGRGAPVERAMRAYGCSVGRAVGSTLCCAGCERRV